METNIVVSSTKLKELYSLIQPMPTNASWIHYSVAKRPGIKERERYIDGDIERYGETYHRIHGDEEQRNTSRWETQAVVRE